jgi:aldose 1-epimerase
MMATNVGRDACPYGCGFHPYLTLGQALDGLTLEAPARTVLHSDARGLPTGAAPVDGTELDFRRARPVGGTVLDHCYTDLERHADGLARVVLGNPAAARAVTLWLDDTYPYVMLFSGDPFPDVARRALAVEPMSCPPNAFHTGTNVRRLEPGDSTSGSWGISLAE